MIVYIALFSFYALCILHEEFYESLFSLANSMFLYYNCSVGKTRNRYFRRASHEGRDEGAKIFQQHRRRKQMKKRVLSAILAVAVLVSVILSVSLPAFAERQIIIDEVGTAMSKSEMQKYVKEFITVATGQVKRDDYQKMPEGMQTKDPATVKLEEQLAQATAMFKSWKTVTEEEAEAFLLELFGGWDNEKFKFVDANKPYGDFQDALLLRYKALDQILYKDETRGFSNLVREEYTIDSWEVIADFMRKLEIDYFTVSAAHPYTGLAEATRSEVYYILQDYFKIVDSLVKIDGDEEALEINRLKGYLFDTLNMEKLTGISFDLYLNRGDSDDTSELAQTVRERLHLGDKAAARKALEDWISGAKATFEDPNATVEDIEKYITTDLLMTDSNGALVACPFTPEELEEQGYELFGTTYYKKSQMKEDGKPVFDDEGKPVYEYKATTYHYDYTYLRNSTIQRYIDTLFVHSNFRDYKNYLYFLMENENHDGGAYDEDAWNTYTAAFSTGDSLLGTPEAKETDFYAALETIMEAHETFKQVPYLVKAYESYGNSIIKFYKENYITDASSYEESFDNDELLNSDVFDIDALRAFRRVLILYNDAMAKLAELKAEGKQDTSDFKFWEEIAKARIIDLVAAKGSMPYSLSGNNEAEDDGMLKFFRNDAQIVDVARAVAEKARAYYNDIISDVTGDSGTDKYPFTEDDAVTFGEDITQLERLLLKIDNYEKNIEEGNYDSIEEADAAATKDEDLLNALNNLFFDMTNMQLEYYYE